MPSSIIVSETSSSLNGNGDHPFLSCYLTLTKYTIIYIIYIELPVHKNDTVLLYVNLVSFSEYCLLYLTIGKGREGKGREGLC